MPKVQWLVKDIFGKEGHRGGSTRTRWLPSAAQGPIQGAQLLLGSKSEILLIA